MRMSRLFSQTLREAPSEADTDSHRLLLRAGFIRQTASGIFSFLPLGYRTLMRIASIIREEMVAIGGQEVLMPVVNPGELWKESKRWDWIDAELGRFKDRAGRDLALAMTHEEVLSDLARQEIRSYRQLPQLLFHIQTKWRDDPRPRAGLIRTREFLMKDSYSLDADWEGLERQYQAHYQAYFRIFKRCGLPEVMAVAADVGMMGGSLAHEFIFPTPIGEDTILVCDRCGYSANRQIAKFHKSPIPDETIRPLEKVATPDCKTIEELASYLGIPTNHTAKAVFMIAEFRRENGDSQVKFVFAIVRGDMEVNETKLLNAIGARALRPATEAEIRAIGAEPGYASPIGIKTNTAPFPVVVVVDDLIPHSPNLVAGANETGFHLVNVNYGRDYIADIVQDITAARQGDGCPSCHAPMHTVRGVEVGNIFKLGARFSQAMGCTFLDHTGEEKPILMGSYGIGLGRLMACVAEAHHDEKGLIWPISVAPYPVHLVVLEGRRSGAEETDKDSIRNLAEELDRNLNQAGIEALFDDRSESPGVKFNDADLIGLPIRVTLSERSLQRGGVEIKHRYGNESFIIPTDRLVEWCRQEIVRLEGALQNP